MLKITEYIRPGGKTQKHSLDLSKSAPELETFFLDNGVEVSFERGDSKTVFVYAELAGPQEPLTLIQLSSGSVPILSALEKLKELFENYLKNCGDRHRDVLENRTPTL